jgi:hypothetical protein
MKRSIECFLILICGCAFCDAQQALSIAGGEAAGTGGTVIYTIGQTDYITVTGTSGVVRQGVQQPFLRISDNQREVKTFKIIKN